MAATTAVGRTTTRAIRALTAKSNAKATSAKSPWLMISSVQSMLSSASYASSRNRLIVSPIDEGSDDGRLSFDLGHIAAGNKYRLFMEFQVNPNNVGSRDQDVELLDGKTHITTIHRSVFVFP